MLKRDAEKLLDESKDAARKNLLNIILKSGGMLDQLNETDIGKTPQFKNVCNKLGSINSGAAFLKKFVENPNDEQTQKARKDLKTAINNCFANANTSASPEQDDANLIFLLLKELMAKDIERLDLDKIIYLSVDVRSTKSYHIERACKFNNMIRRSADQKGEAEKQFNKLDVRRILKYYYVSSTPKEDPEPDDLEMFRTTVKDACDLYLKLLNEGGTDKEKLEFTRYFVSTNTIRRAEDQNKQLRIINYFTPEHDKALRDISNVLFSNEPISKLEYDINTQEGLEKLFQTYTTTVLPNCVNDVIEQLNRHYKEFSEYITNLAAQYDISLSAIANGHTLKDYILNLYKVYENTATGQEKSEKLAVCIGSMFYPSELQRMGCVAYDGPDYEDYVIACNRKIKPLYNKAKAACKNELTSLYKFLGDYIEIEDGHIIYNVCIKSVKYIETIYSSQFAAIKDIDIKKCPEEVQNAIKYGLSKFDKPQK